MKDFAEFIAWEKASQDTIDFKKIYADVAEDTLAGLVLAQIIYWHIPNKEGKSKLRIQKEGKAWMACNRAEWWEKTRLSPRQIDRVLGILESKNVILKKIFRFNGTPIVHIHLKTETLLLLMNHLTNNPPINPYTENQEVGGHGEMDFTNPLNQSLPNGEMDFDESVESLTKSTSENTKREKNIVDYATIQESKNRTTSEKPRDRLFDGVSLVCFGIHAEDASQKEVLQANRGRIGKLVKFLKSVDASPESLWAFNNWYCGKYPNTSLPNDLAKFSKHYNDFLAWQRGIVASKTQSSARQSAIEDYSDELRSLKD